MLLCSLLRHLLLESSSDYLLWAGTLGLLGCTRPAKLEETALAHCVCERLVSASGTWDLAVFIRGKVLSLRYLIEAALEVNVCRRSLN